MQLTPANTTPIEQLYRQHGGALVLFATAIGGERSRAQDAVHHVFLKLLEHGDRDLRRALDVKAYLFASVRNAVLNDTRSRRRDVALEQESAWFDPPNRDFAAEANLRRALLALPVDQREVTILHVWCELTFAQIAEVLGVSLNTAASRYRYALAKLREAMCTEERSCEQP
jgi:RNA polymerase sigma-70 factor, ECF subfamily